MEWEFIHIDETDSTNRWLADRLSDGQTGSREGGDSFRREDQGIVVWADFQTAGRGCGSNKWESERGQNLLFSVLLHPQDIPATRQFHISMAISLAICKALGQQIGDLSIKWPNDIYWRNAKIAGILIENTLKGAVIKDCIIGVGLNVNQQVFRSDAPNPISLWQIHGHTTDREQLLRDIVRCFEHYLYADVREQYTALLYRRKGFHPYADMSGAFMAEIVDVEDDGHLLLRDETGQSRRYAFKEVQFII